MTNEMKKHRAENTICCGPMMIRPKVPPSTVEMTPQTVMDFILSRLPVMVEPSPINITTIPVIGMTTL